MRSGELQCLLEVAIDEDIAISSCLQLEFCFCRIQKSKTCGFIDDKALVLFTPDCDRHWKWLSWIGMPKPYTVIFAGLILLASHWNLERVGLTGA